jgi:hypothetical protein
MKFEPNFILIYLMLEKLLEPPVHENWLCY